jgi:hypothetical protein
VSFTGSAYASASRTRFLAKAESAVYYDATALTNGAVDSGKIVGVIT